MSEQLLTQCPHCSTTFRLATEHLDVANGAVRCGACYQVFQARDYIVNETAQSSADLPTTDITELAPELAADLKSSAKGVPGISRRSEKQQSWTDEVFEDDTEQESYILPSSAKDDAPSPNDVTKTRFDSIQSGENIYDEAYDTTETAFESSKTSSDLVNDLVDIDHYSDDQTELVIDEDSEAWAKQMLDELEAEDDPREGLSLEALESSSDPTTPSAALSKRLSQPSSQKQRIDDTLDQTDQTQLAINPPSKDSDSTDRLRAKPRSPLNLSLDSVKSVLRDKITQRAFYKQEKSYKMLGIIGLNILAIVCLVGQYAYFNRDTLAVDQRFRPYYQFFCAPFDCELPAQVDIAKIETKLVLRPHPKISNALIIDALLYNRAEFEQPYPDIVLSFEDINGQPVASRRFVPQDYFRNKVPDLSKMPKDTPVRVTLEINDPGRNAVNYQMVLLPQTPTVIGNDDS